jgi:hypothetical protein
MDAVDALIFAGLALIDLALLFYLRWRRGHQGRIERRVCRALRLAYQTALQ